MLAAGVHPIGRELRAPPPQPQRLHDAPAGQRRDMARRIADEHDPPIEGAPESRSRGNEPATPSDDAPWRQTQARGIGVQKRARVGSNAVSRRESHLCHADARHRPGDVARRQVAVQEAMQEPPIERGFALQFELDAAEETFVRVEPERARDGGRRAVRADQQPSSQIETTERDASLVLNAPLERRAEHKLGAGATRLLRHPAQ
jgi:hypothetical protein